MDAEKGWKMLKNSMLFGAAALVVAAAGPASAQFLMVGDNSGDKVQLFDAFDGTLIDSEFLLLDDIVGDWTGSFFDRAGQPRNAIQVGNEIWVSDNSEDSIFRINGSTKTVIGRVGGSTSDFGGTGGLDDIRGLDYHAASNRVYVVNDGTSNVAPGDDTIVTINATTGAIEGSFSIRGEAEDVLIVGNELFVSNVDGNTTTGDGSDDTVDVYDLDGTYLRTILDSPGQFPNLTDPRQLSLSANGLLIADSIGIFEYGLDGTFLESWLNPDTGILSDSQGVHELGNGDILFTVNNFGVYTLDRLTGEVVLQSAGDPFFIEATSIPTPGAFALLGAAGFAGMRRRR